MYQMKEQDKTPEKQLNEVEIGNLPEKEFRIMIVKMIQDLGKRMEVKIEKMQEMFLKDLEEGFPGGAVVENPPANAGDMGSSPGLGGSHMPRSDWAHEPQLLSCASAACAPQRERPRWWEARAPR